MLSLGISLRLAKFIFKICSTDKVKFRFLTNCSSCSQLSPLRKRTGIVLLIHSCSNSCCWALPSMSELKHGYKYRCKMTYCEKSAKLSKHKVLVMSEKMFYSALHEACPLTSVRSAEIKIIAICYLL